jgi:hypothetical protein
MPLSAAVAYGPQRPQASVRDRGRSFAKELKIRQRETGERFETPAHGWRSALAFAAPGGQLDPFNSDNRVAAPSRASAVEPSASGRLPGVGIVRSELWIELRRKSWSLR